MNFEDCILQPLNEKRAMEISLWEYEKPYDIYNFKGHANGYLLDKTTWGLEQFALCYNDRIIGLVTCQFDNNQLWVGWSLSPELCGKGDGSSFIEKCVKEIRLLKKYKGTIYLRVAAFNKRAIKAYQKAGFTYLETIQDEIAYSNKLEDFWVMVKD